NRGWKLINRNLRAASRKRAGGPELSDAVETGVNVHRSSAQKAHKGLAAISRKLDSEARWSRDGGNHRNALRERFVHDPERCASADQNHVVGQWKSPAQEGPADHLIHRVVPANVLPANEQISAEIENSSRMQPACPGERFLSPAHF